MGGDFEALARLQAGIISLGIELGIFAVSTRVSFSPRETVMMSGAFMESAGRFESRPKPQNVPLPEPVRSSEFHPTLDGLTSGCQVDGHSTGSVQ
jgi:hypothetical protein